MKTIRADISLEQIEVGLMAIMITRDSSLTSHFLYLGHMGFSTALLH